MNAFNTCLHLRLFILLRGLYIVSVATFFGVDAGCQKWDICNATCTYSGLIHGLSRDNRGNIHWLFGYWWGWWSAVILILLFFITLDKMRIYFVRHGTDLLVLFILSFSPWMPDSYPPVSVCVTFSLCSHLLWEACTSTSLLLCEWLQTGSISTFGVLFISLINFMNNFFN